MEVEGLDLIGDWEVEQAKIIDGCSIGMREQLLGQDKVLACNPYPGRLEKTTTLWCHY